MLTTAQNDPDYQLVQQLQNDPGSGNFEKLVSKYHEQIYRFSFRFLGNADDAADCCQEVFIKIFRHLSSFRSESSLNTWIYRIALNTCKDMTRRKKTRPWADSRYSSEKTMNIEDNFIAPAKENPETILLRQEINLAFQAGLQKLRPRQRQVLILRDVDGKSYEEISDITGIRLGTVRSTLARARFQMASLLKEFRHEMQ